MIKAFVTGATGFTGRELVPVLVQKGVETYAHVRPDSPRLDYWRTRFQADGAQVDTTAWTLDALTATLARVQPDLVFCLIGTTLARGRRVAQETGGRVRDTYESVDYGLTALLVEACAILNCRFIYLSAVGTGPSASTPYGKARWKAEDAVRKGISRFVIARPSIITGKGRDDPRPMEKAGAIVFDSILWPLKWFGAARTVERFSSITNIRLAEALAELGLRDDADGMTFEGEDLQRLSR